MIINIGTFRSWRFRGCSDSGGGWCGGWSHLVTAGHWSRLTGGAGRVSLLTAGEKDTDIGQDPGHVVVPETDSGYLEPRLL